MLNRVKDQRYILKYDFELELRLTKTNSVLTSLLVLKLFLLPLHPYNVWSLVVNKGSVKQRVL